jgi:hypothetical protein
LQIATRAYIEGLVLQIILPNKAEKVAPKAEQVATEGEEIATAGIAVDLLRDKLLQA